RRRPARQGGGRQREAQRRRRRRPPCPGQARCRDPGRLRGRRRRPARQARRLTRRRCSLRIGRNRSPRGGPMGHRRLAVCVVITVVALLAVIAPAGAAPEGQMTWGVHISLAPTWFDPAEKLGIINPLLVMYAINDALTIVLPGIQTRWVYCV